MKGEKSKQIRRLNKWNEKEEKVIKNFAKIFFSKKFIDQDDCHPFFLVCTFHSAHGINILIENIPEILCTTSVYRYIHGAICSIQYKYKGVELGDTLEILCVLTLNGFHKIFIFFDYLLDDIRGYV